MISQETVEKIYNTVRIEEVIGDYVSLKRSGSNYKGLSPFTNERTPSFLVSPSKQIFKCFSSGIGGNVVKFLMEHDKFSYPEALRVIADKYNIEVVEDEKDEVDQNHRNEIESLYIITKKAHTLFVENNSSEEGEFLAIPYLMERGFSESTIAKFEIGYSIDSWDSLTSSLSSSGFSDEYLLKSGLSKKKSSGKLYDGWRGRIMFPIHNLTGKVVGFTGRVLGDEKPKYVNTPENAIYNKSKILYGLYQSKTDIIKKDNCFLVEGQTDVISLHQHGVTNVVSSSGTSLTVEQIGLIKRFTNNITILYDGDNAGIKASFRGIDLILQQGMNVHVVLFPEGQDPDGFAQSYGGEELVKFIHENKKDFLLFKYDVLSKSEEDVTSSSEVIKEVLSSIKLVGDEVKKTLYLRELSKITSINESALRSSIPRDSSSTRVRKVVEEVVEKKPMGKFEHEERAVISTLIRLGEEKIIVDTDEGKQEVTVAEFILSELYSDEIQFNHEGFDAIFQEYIEVFEAGEDVDSKYFISHDKRIIRETANDVISIQDSNTNPKGETIRVISALKRRHLDEMIEEVSQKIAETKETDKVIELMREQKHLNKVKNELIFNINSIDFDLK